MYPKIIQDLIDRFAKFPTIGSRTATRFVFYLLKLPPNELEELARSLLELKKQVHLCAFCYRPFDAMANPDKIVCDICANPGRDTSILCVVEKESDLETLERTHQYKGLYFILGGTVGMLRKEDLRRVRGEELVDHIKSPAQFGLPAAKPFSEIIIATNLTTEGEATALYVERLLKPLSIKTARLGRGLPLGGEIEYADEETLRNALEGRK